MTTRPNQLDERGGTKPLDAPNALLGRILDGRFQLLSVLNAGGMGIVYKARQLSVSRDVAVKILKPTLSEKTELVRRFRQEVEVIATLDHPNIVTLIEAGKDAGGLTYLVMEFVEGQTFRQALKQEALELDEILEVFIQTCDALGEAHQAGVVHRDLKFDNIMVTRRDSGRLHVRVLDFGVAKLITRDLDLTRNGQVPGTPGIIAPELIDEQAPLPQSDLYSLGVLLYTALCGQAPFAGENDLELMRAHKYQEVPAIEARVGSEVPDELIDLTYRLLAKQPGDRPASAHDVREECLTLQQMLRHHAPRSLSQARREALGFDEDFGASLAFERPRAPEPRNWFERFLRAFFGDEPVVAPTSVVVFLAMLLFVLVIIIIYMFMSGVA